MLKPFDSQQILQLRPQLSRPVPGHEPLDTQWEQEAFYDASGDVQATDVITIFLRGSECSFRCLMCDLWKFTHLERTPDGAIPAQIANALDNVDLASRQGAWIKLYNASNFFSARNVPSRDLTQIARQLDDFQRIIVENHPSLCQHAIDFSRQLEGKLEVAMGLETTHPEVLPRLNKQMTLDDFQHACNILNQANIDIRAFVLLCPPWLEERDAEQWCSHSITFAQQCGVRHVSVIPTRSGNGAIEQLQRAGQFHPPSAAALERILAEHIGQQEFVVTADVWDWQQLRGLCQHCSSLRLERMRRMNLTQRRLPKVDLPCRCSHES